MAADLTSNEPRYRSVNVLSFDLDMPERTTADYETDVNPNVRAALTAALRDDEQLEVEAEENLPSMGLGGSGWTPGGADAGTGLGRIAAGMSNSIAANKMRQGGGEQAARKKAAAKAAQRRKKDDDDLDALLSGGSSKPAAPSAAEQFPTSRGLGGRRRGGGM